MECDTISPDQPLRQGDIVAAQPGSVAWTSPWTRFGVIITADCDIAQNKAGPNLAYLPVISHFAYLADVWLPATIATYADDARKRLDAAAGKLQSGLTGRHIEAWYRTLGDEGVTAKLEDLRSTAADEVFNSVTTIWNAVRFIIQNSTQPSLTNLDRLSELLQSLVGVIKVVAPDRVKDLLSRQRLIQDALSSLEDRLDYWLLHQLSGLDPDMQEVSNYGFVVSLRSFSLLPTAIVHTDRTKWYPNKEHYVRVCQLRPRYKSDLIHQFANLFMRVGLEDYRVLELRRAFKRSAEHLFPQSGSQGE